MPNDSDVSSVLFNNNPINISDLTQGFHIYIVMGDSVKLTTVSAVVWHASPPSSKIKLGISGSATRNKATFSRLQHKQVNTKLTRVSTSYPRVWQENQRQILPTRKGSSLHKYWAYLLGYHSNRDGNLHMAWELHAFNLSLSHHLLFVLAFHWLSDRFLLSLHTEFIFPKSLIA